MFPCFTACRLFPSLNVFCLSSFPYIYKSFLWLCFSGLFAAMSRTDRAGVDKQPGTIVSGGPFRVPHV